MKHKEDIYSQPKKFISEYFAGILAMLVAVVFLGFEFLSFTFNKQEPIASDHNSVKTKQECNSSATSVALEDLTKPKALIPLKTVTEPLKVDTVEPKPVQKTFVENASIKDEATIALNPIDQVLKTINETESWKVQSSFSDYSDDEKQKLLEHAIQNNHAKNLQKLLDQGYAFKTPYYMGDVNKLIFNRKYDVVILLTNLGLIDLHRANQYGYTLLHEASAKGHSALVRLLVSKGLDINSQSKSGASALHYPTRYGYSITVGTLLELGIDPNLKATLNYPGVKWNQWTALHIAANRGHTKVLKKLLEADADPSIKDANGMTAYDIAKERGHENIIALLAPKQKSEQVAVSENNDTVQSDVNDVTSENMTQDSEVDHSSEGVQSTTQEVNQDELSEDISDSNTTTNSL